ncbi:MAG TPA: hypothetical protein VIS57_11745 [Xanthomonadales bacterium]
MFDLPGPLFGVIDGVLAMALSPLLRLVIWGVLAGWITMLVYRLFSNQEKIGALKALQKSQQKAIAEFDGEFAQLLPLIRQTLGLGFKQLGFTLGPALLATVPVLFVVIWVAGEFGHTSPAAGSELVLSVEPANSDIHWSPASSARADESGWVVRWPAQGQSLTMSDGHQTLLVLPLKHDIPVIHKKRWWNLLVANPLGYLPEEGTTDIVHIGLPEVVIIASGPAWLRGWMFSFFLAFILSSVGFKFLLRLD